MTAKKQTTETGKTTESATRADNEPTNSFQLAVRLSSWLGGLL